MKSTLSIVVLLIASSPLVAQVPVTPATGPGASPAAQEPATDERSDTKDLPVNPPPRAEAPAANAAAAVTETPAEPVAILTRLADPVAALDAETRVEKPLFHWEKTFGLRVGDGLRQGVAAISEIFFPDDLSEIRCFGATHWFLDSVKGENGGAQHRIRVLELRRMRIDARKAETVLALPGGTQLKFATTVLQLGLDERNHRYQIKNDGPGEVRIEGPIVPLAGGSLLAGQVVQIPLVLDPTTAATPGKVADSWSGLSLDLPESVRGQRQGDSLELEGTGVARVGGARIVLNGHPVRVYKPRGGFTQ